MKSKIILYSIFSLFFVCALSIAILQLDFTKKSKSHSKSESISHVSEVETKSEISHREVKNVLSENPEIEKYILRYDPSSRMVLLTTSYKDGSELISHVKSIDPAFLEEDDVHALLEGIELQNKEDIFMLIEDYSN